ncbi:glycosyltransferase [Pontiella agarivorans]|uniref:Glycosyltransferase n=1 Tax=Pontiella agarivorans TaxID=3038953 RepID=A0ABU5MT59_9BACT|nr:glycosyltransferase [Pontiella agarivorans]MDZ8117333.1 glycosyltransferase [Pontiella agarivorans]
MHFSVITPCLNQIEYLKRCIASIHDQVVPGTVSVHHHIQDGGSSDGTIKFLESEINKNAVMEGYRLSFSSGKDRGMYDALNQGIDFLCAEMEDESGIFAWLNCDEQYLPDTLVEVAHAFEQNSSSDFLCGNTLNLDDKYQLLTFKKNPLLRERYVQADFLYVQSAASFFRDKIFRNGLRFGDRWKVVEDSDFFLTLLRHGFRPSRLNKYLAILVMTGNTLSESETGLVELDAWRATMPLSSRLFRIPLNICRYLEKWMHGGYCEKFPLTYSVYTQKTLDTREEITAYNGTFRFTWGVK